MGSGYIPVVRRTSGDRETRPARFRHYRWLVFGILASGYMLVSFHRMCPAVLAVDLMRDLGTGGALTGLLSAAYFYPYAIMQLPAGLLADSWGSRHTVTVFFLVAAVGSAVLGLAMNTQMAFAGRLLVGLGMGMLFVPTMKVMAEWFRTSEFVQVAGLLVAAGGLGSLSATIPLVWLNLMIGWRGSFLVAALGTALAAVLVWLLVRNRPADMGWPAAGPVLTTTPRTTRLLEGVGVVLSCPHFWPLAFWLLLNCGIFFAFAGLWGGPYLMQVYGLSQDRTGRILAMLSMGMVFGSPLLCTIAQHLVRRRKPVLIVSNVIVVGITALLGFRTASIPVWGLYGICLGLGVFSSAVAVLAVTMNKELFPVAIAGTATGLINLFPFVGGGILQPLIGYILERHAVSASGFTTAGYASAFRVFFGAASIALLLSLFFREKRLQD